MCSCTVWFVAQIQEELYEIENRIKQNKNTAIDFLQGHCVLKVGHQTRAEFAAVGAKCTLLVRVKTVYNPQNFRLSADD